MICGGCFSSFRHELVLCLALENAGVILLISGLSINDGAGVRLKKK